MQNGQADGRNIQIEKLPWIFIAEFGSDGKDPAFIVPGAIASLSDCEPKYDGGLLSVH